MSPPRATKDLRRLGALLRPAPAILACVRHCRQLADDTLAAARRHNLVPGRKSLSGGSVHSPRVQFRVPESLRVTAEKRASEKGVSLSELAREALEHYLAS